jgi:predicted MPP superfamily phosphohydrolase
MSSSTPSRGLTRRRLLQLLGGLTLSAAAALAYTRVVEPHWVDVETISLRLPGLAPRLAGKRIVQLSDLHLCEFFSAERLMSIMPTVNQLRPDWVILTGDYVGDQSSAAQGLVEPLRRIEAPIYASLGNHDYWSHVQTVTAMLEEGNARVLRNTATPLDDGLWLAGVDDLWSGRPDLKQTLDEIPTDVTTLLLAHEPDFFDTVVQQQAPVAAQFSGHSHGGQVRLPLLKRGVDGLHSYAPILPRYGQRYPIGLRQVGVRQVYTSRGLGLWPMPFRFNCRPEITLITLEAAG